MIGTRSDVGHVFVSVHSVSQWIHF